MEVKDFVKTVIAQVVTALEESEQELGRAIHLSLPADKKSIEFDLATTVESSFGKEGKLQGAVKILGIGTEGSGLMKTESKDSYTSRVKFGISVNAQNKKQEEERCKEIETAYQQSRLR